jgi:hypothetical protein
MWKGMRYRGGGTGGELCKTGAGTSAKEIQPAGVHSKLQVKEAFGGQTGASVNAACPWFPQCPANKPVELSSVFDVAAFFAAGAAFSFLVQWLHLPHDLQQLGFLESQQLGFSELPDESGACTKSGGCT